MFESVRGAVAWYVEGLTEALAAIDDLIRRRTPIQLIQVDGGYAIEHGGVRRATPLHLERSNDDTRLVPAEAAQTIKDHDVDVVLKSDDLLVRTLDPLPPESRPYLDNIVRHQLERLVPWRADNVLHSYRVGTAGTRDERLAVTVCATARSLHAAILEALAALAPRKVRLVYPDVPQVGGEVAIDINGGGRSSDRIRRIRRAAVAATLAVLVIGIGALAYLGNSWLNADDVIAANDQSIAGLHKQLTARGAGNPAANRDLDMILARRRAQPPVALVIEALSATLPDDTWLTELQIADGNVRVSGVSHNVAQLVPLVEGSPLFAEATFFAPTTRLPDGASDRFHLQARLLPAGGGKK